MYKITATAYLKDGSTLPINYYNHFCGNLIDFTITVEGEEVDFLFDNNATKIKWKERDIEAEKKHHENGYYKKARFDFDRIEIHTIIG